MRPKGSAPALARTGDSARPSAHLLLIPLLALFVVHPLIVHGCSCGHDFDFHLLSWMEAATQISHGNLHPHWAFTPAWNAGEPRFVFYPPLSWYLGALLGLALAHLPGVSQTAGWTAAPIVFTWIALTLSGFAMHRLARTYAGASAALLAAAFYLANPYMLFTAYERTAFAELLAAAWMPLLLEAILSKRIAVARIALPVALLWLTNAPAAVMGCYALALLAATRIVLDREASVAAAVLSALRVAAGAALGFGLAAFYLLPAAYERHWVQIAMAGIGGMRIDRNFLFQHTGSTPDDILHDQVLRAASWIAIALLLATVAALAAAWRRSRAGNAAPQLASAELPFPPLPFAPLVVLAAAIALALTPLSAPLWRLAPEAALLQFPWRLLAVLAPACALALAVALSAGLQMHRRSGADRAASSGKAAPAALLIAAALGLPAWHLFRQPCDPDDTAPARLALFHSSQGTDPTDEYTPAVADNDSLAQDNPPWRLAASSGAPAPATAQTGTVPAHFSVAAPRAEFLILNLRDYPAWLVLRNGAPVAARPARADGLIAIPVPAGKSAIDLRYAQRPDQTAGDAVGILSLLILLALFAWRPSARAPQPA